MAYRTRVRGFTAVELIVILCAFVLMASLVAPQFASASSASLKDSIRWELGRATDALWMYERETGEQPGLGTGAGHLGWGALIERGYLDNPPYNAYVGSSRLDSFQGQLVASTRPSSGDAGWGVFEGVLFAVGYDATMNLLSEEDGYRPGPVHALGPDAMPDGTVGRD